MAPRRQMPPPPPPARVFESIGEIDRGIEKIRRRIQDVERLASEKISHRDAAVDNVEHAIVDTIRDVFGEGSAQFQRHNYFRIDDGPMRMMGFHESPAAFNAQRQRQFEQHLPGAITRLQGLIQQLEEKRRDFAQDNAGSLAGDSQLDALTGLPLRGDVEPYFAGHTTNRDVPLSMVLFDIDRFKNVNDAPDNGHATGDEALKSIAAVAQACVTGKGSAFRFGGDEFMLLLPNHTVEEGIAVAERLRRTVAASPRTSKSLSLTLSVGVAQWPEHGDDFDGLYKAADRALYDAKNRGRNLVRYYGEPEPAAAPSVREPARRQPEPGGLTDDEQRKIREDYFRTRTARCPRDQAALSVHDITTQQSPRNALLIRCPMCGLEGTLD
jgi:diguanylate cyclase (GGDEF)-like protein